MTYVLGVDIGTSFTAAAIARLDGGTRPVPEALSLGLRGDSVASKVFLNEDGLVVVGEAAEQRARNRPDRVVRDFMRRVGDTVPIVVGDLCVAPEDVFATIARWVVDRAEESEGASPAAVTFSHPASWGLYRTEVIRTALAGVGLADATLLSEPEAAALHHATDELVALGSTIAIYDLGGTTLDVAILKKSSSDAFARLGGATGGIERLGGDDLDDAVLGHVAASVGDAFAHFDVTDPGVLATLSRLREECTEAKEALSFAFEANISVDLPGVQAQVRLERSEFERIIEGSVRESIGAVDRALQAANVGADELATIVLIGGSSRIPLVSRLLAEEFGRPIARDAYPASSVSRGLAFAAATAVLEIADAGQDAEHETTERDVMASAIPFGTRVGTRAKSFASSASGVAKVARTRVGRRVPAAAAIVGALVLTGAIVGQGLSDAFVVASPLPEWNSASDLSPSFSSAPLTPPTLRWNDRAPVRQAISLPRFAEPNNSSVAMRDVLRSRSAPVNPPWAPSPVSPRHPQQDAAPVPAPPLLEPVDPISNPVTSPVNGG